jgi:hypothetical protein
MCGSLAQEFALAWRSNPHDTETMQAARSKQSWGSVAQVILGPDPQLALYGEAVVWFHKVELFRQNPAPADLALHKELLLRLITDGEHLGRLIDQHGFLPNAEGTTVDDLKATVQNLRADYRGWHEPMPDAERAQVLREVFDGPKPAH